MSFNKNILEGKKNEEIVFRCHNITINETYEIQTVIEEDLKKFTNWIKEQSNSIKQYDGGEIRERETESQREKRIKLEKIKFFYQLRDIKKTHCYWNFGFSSTINKAQGSSYDEVYVLNSKNPHFGNKQKYTAISRAKNVLKIFER